MKRVLGAILCCVVAAAACGGGDGPSGGGSGGMGAAGGASGGVGGTGAGSGGTSGSAGFADGGGGTPVGGAGGMALDCKSHAGATAATACASYALEYCKLIEKCDTFAFYSWGFESVSDCAGRSALECQLILSAPGNTLQPALYAASANLFGPIDCVDYNSGNVPWPEELPPECGGPGTRLNGESCSFGSQCASSLCPTGLDEVCGKCSDGQAGAPCEWSIDCADGLNCSYPNMTCVVPVAVGADCSNDDVACPVDAYCKFETKKCTAYVGLGVSCADAYCEPGLVCGDAGTCKIADYKPLGADCSTTESRSCNENMGLECSKTTHTCVAVPLPGPGQECGTINTDAGSFWATNCSGGAQCVQPTVTGPHVCMLTAADGAACDSIKGPECRLPAKCIAGKCTLPGGATCGS